MLSIISIALYYTAKYSPLGHLVVLLGAVGLFLSLVLLSNCARYAAPGQVAGWSSSLALLGSGAPMLDIGRDLLDVFPADRLNLGRLGVLPMFSATVPPGFYPFHLLCSLL